MDILLLINILFILFFFFLKRTRRNYLPFYSFSLIVGIFTCLYLFYRYAVKACDSVTEAYIYTFASPLLLLIDCALLFLQNKKPEGLGVISYLENLLTVQVKRAIDKIILGILFYTLITVITYLLTLFYESIYCISDPYYSLTVTQFLWQFLYLIPLLYIFWYMGLKKFSITIVVCSIVFYPVIIYSLVLLKIV
jgi:hypothetical protein